VKFEHFVYSVFSPTCTSVKR